MEQAILSLENVSKFYTSGQNVVVGLNNVSLSFRRGEFVAITGESGSGKSTLSHVLGGILPYESGELCFGGKPTSHYDSSDWERYRRDHISFISQNYGILPGTTVLKNVVSALRLSGMEKNQANQAARQILEQVELWELRSRRAAKLSSGQKQRLSIARALAKPAPILIADEPTGNLDPENSAKVIQLLAQAAKSRLVLLVTHEFEEARDFATRHIRLQDGRVVMDAALREAEDPEPLPTAHQKDKSSKSLYVARLQLSSRPVWSAIMSLFFALTAFAVFAFLGAFIIALDDTDARIYDDSAFLNGSRTRIAVTTLDQQPMTQDDYDIIANREYVTALERNGYVTDTQYSYRNGVDYTTIHTEHVEGPIEAPVYVIETSYQIHTDAPYMQTVPVLSADQTFLKEGSLPQNFYDVVAHSSDGYQIGDKVDVFLTNRRYWGKNIYLKLSFTVVGITDHGSGLYFSDDMGRFCQQTAKSGSDTRYNLFIPENLYDPYKPIIPEELLPEGTDFTLKDNEMVIHSSLMSQHLDESDPVTHELTLLFSNVNLEGTELDPHIIANKVPLSTPTLITIHYEAPDGSVIDLTVGQSLHDFDYFTRLIIVSQNTFDKMTIQTASEQVSVTIEDYAYTQEVIDDLTELGYVAVSPFQLGSTKLDEEKAAQREQTLSVCLLALIAVAALQIVVLRAMYSAQTESYQLLRNIGLVSRSAKRSILWQILCFTVLGQLLGGGAIWLCGALGIERIVHILRYLPPACIALLSGVHLAAALLAALLVTRALAKQVYPHANRHSDLSLTDDGKEAAL